MEKNKKIIDYVNENICAVGIQHENELKKLLEEMNTLRLTDYSKSDKQKILQVTRFFRIYLINMNPPEPLASYFHNLFDDIGREVEKV